jgi:hypothetical protein
MERSQSLMDRLREKPGLLALGVAAIATAGYLVFKGLKASKAPEPVPDSESEQVREET